VVEGCSGLPPRGGRAVCTLYGPVELDTESEHFIGAEVGSNNTGELSAMCEAFKWLAEHETSGRPAVVCYDSEYAANQAQNLHQAHKNHLLSARSTVRVPPMATACPHWLFFS
jgi:ribonuclease HI